MGLVHKAAHVITHLLEVLGMPKNEKIEGWIAIGIGVFSFLLHVVLLSFAIKHHHDLLAIWCIAKIMISLLLLLAGDKLEKKAQTSLTDENLASSETLLDTIKEGTVHYDD